MNALASLARTQTLQYPSSVSTVRVEPLQVSNCVRLQGASPRCILATNTTTTAARLSNEELATIVIWIPSAGSERAPLSLGGRNSFAFDTQFVRLSCSRPATRIEKSHTHGHRRTDRGAHQHRPLVASWLAGRTQLQRSSAPSPVLLSQSRGHSKARSSRAIQTGTPALQHTRAPPLKCDSLEHLLRYLPPPPNSILWPAERDNERANTQTHTRQVDPSSGQAQLRPADVTNSAATLWPSMRQRPAMKPKRSRACLLTTC